MGTGCGAVGRAVDMHAMLSGHSVRAKLAHWSVLRAPVRRKAPRCFPKLAFNDRKTAAGGELENQTGDVFGGGILIHKEQRLAHLLKQWYGRIGFLQQHPMVELFVDPGADD